MEIGKLELSVDSSAITKAADEVERLVFALVDLQRVTGDANVEETFDLLCASINDALKDGRMFWGGK